MMLTRRFADVPDGERHALRLPLADAPMAPIHAARFGSTVVDLMISRDDDYDDDFDENGLDDFDDFDEDEVDEDDYDDLEEEEDDYDDLDDYDGNDDEDY